jgi:hypothetical protein
MNAISDALCDLPLASASTQAETFTLRRTGRRPTRFDGWLLVEASSAPDAGGVQYDVRLYRSTRGRIVAELVAHRGEPDAPDLEHVETLASLEEAADWLLRHRCASDLSLPAALNHEDTPLLQAALLAVRVRQQTARLQDEYNALLSDVFTALGIAEPLEAADAA